MVAVQTIVDDVVKQASQDAMNVNGKKTKEMLIGPINKNPPPPLTLEGTVVDRVRTFKLHGVHVADDHKWQQHVDAINIFFYLGYIQDSILALLPQTV